MRLVIGCWLLVIGCFPVEAQKLKFVKKLDEQRVDLFYGKKLLTSCIYYDSLFKYALYPITTQNGNTITRQYPYTKKPGERADHPHHVGLFFAHESVNDHDFWNMSTAIDPAKRNRYGRIRVLQVGTAVEKGIATLMVKARWDTFEKEKLIEETTIFTISVLKKHVFIERRTVLKALTDVTFKDKKDGLLGLRVARELELPVEGNDVFVLPDGSTSEPMANDISKVTGNYRNSESVIGQDVWGKKASWVCLDGKINNKDISIAFLDHEKNIEYPSYWHARGYGLFAINPLGKEVFTDGKAALNLKLKKDELLRFRHWIVIREGEKFTTAELNGLSSDFATFPRVWEY